MLTNPHTRRSFLTAIIFSFVIFVLLIGTHITLADKETSPQSQKEIANSTIGYDDDWFQESGVDWINDLPGDQFDSDRRLFECMVWPLLEHIGMYNYFNWGNNQAHASDFRNSANGGVEELVVDEVDLAMLCSVPCSYGVAFTLDNDWDIFYPQQAEHSYGGPYMGSDLEWLAVDVSYAFADDYIYDWAGTMDRLHLLLGFITQVHESPISLGALWSEYMLGYFNCGILANRVMQAWFHTVDDLQPASACARVVAERDDSFNDYLWGMGEVSSDGSPYDYRPYLNHCSTGPASKELISSYDQPEVLAMPVAQVVDRVVDQDYVMNYIAPAFDMQEADPCFINKTFSVYKISEGMTYTLQVDQITGGFMYQNLSTLWTKPVITPTLPSADIADVIINNWFRNTPAKNLPGASYRNAGSEYMTEDIIKLFPKSGQIGDVQDQPLSDLPIDVSMTYPRVISVTAQTTSGAQVVDFPILGPGGRMKVYLGDQGEIIGVQGGSRDVQATAEMVEILDAKEVWSMFLENPSLAIGRVSLVADTITHTVPALGYYEMPYLVSQDELIPVWEFRGYFYWKGNLVAGDVPIYLPAAAEYMPPQVTILNPPDGSIFWAAESISLEGGITGGTPHYTIEWLSGKSGYLGNTINIITSLTSPIREGTIYTDQISLFVTDANGLTDSDSISMMIKPVFWMPFVNK